MASGGEHTHTHTRTHLGRMKVACLKSNLMDFLTSGNKHHSSIKLQVDTDCWLKLLLFGMQPTVMHEQIHGQLK